MKQFVPLTDDMLYDGGLYRAGGPPVLLVPYHYGVACCHGARDELDYSIDANEANDPEWFNDAQSASRQA